MLRQIEREAQRIDRSLSWIVQRCIREGMAEVRRLASAKTTAGADEHEQAPRT